jgi:glycosyltransferase involved in cell wall biosynthesis
MKILWFSNCPISEQDICGSGSWLSVMANGLVEKESVHLRVIAAGPVKGLTQQSGNRLEQWFAPRRVAVSRNGRPPRAIVDAINRNVQEFAPDLVHVWGTELYWGLITSGDALHPATLLEMQGLKATVAKVYFGGLTVGERIACFGPREALQLGGIGSSRRQCAAWGRHEAAMILGHRFIDVQSPWMAAQVKDINPSARLFDTEIALRSAFHEARPWQPPTSPTIFCIAGYSVPYKGLHVAIKALAQLRLRVPEARLRIAGLHQRPGIRQDGYVRWMNRLIRRLRLEDAVSWLGPLNAEQLVVELSTAAVALIPSFIESYCVALAEAMQVGAPTVVAFTGGTSYLGTDEQTCLFFPPGDEAMCVHQLERLLTDRPLALRLSHNAREVALARNNYDAVVRHQANIYRQVLAATGRPGSRIACPPARLA